MRVSLKPRFLAIKSLIRCTFFCHKKKNVERLMKYCSSAMVDDKVYE